MPFGIKLGLSANKSKTTTTQNKSFSNTTTPVAPDWATGLVQRGAGRVEGLFDLDLRSQTAPPNALLNQAAGSAASLTGGTAGDTSWLKPQIGTATPFASGGKAYDFVDRYLNPYLTEVVGASAADFDANSGRVRAQQALDLAGSGAFGGSGAALTQSMTEGELARARGATLSGLRSRGYETALGAASGDADRATQARISNAQLKLQDQAQQVDFGFQAQQQQLVAEASQRANIATQTQVGGAMRTIDQEQRSAPVTNAQQIVALLSGLPISLFTGQSEQGTSTEAGASKTKGVNATASLFPRK